MSNIKAKISNTMDKVLHHGQHGQHNQTGTAAGGTTSSPSGYNETTGRTGGLDNTSTDYNTTSATGMGTGATTGTGTGTGVTGSEYGTTGTGTGVTGGEYGTTGATTGTGTAGYTTGATEGVGNVIDSETFTKTEDHELLVEKKQYELEHHPVQKQYVVETKFVGETPTAGAPTELVGQEARAVDERTVQAPAGDRTVVVENVDVPAGARTTTGTAGMTGTGTTGTGMGGNTTGTY